MHTQFEDYRGLDILSSVLDGNLGENDEDTCTMVIQVNDNLHALSLGAIELYGTLC